MLGSLHSAVPEDPVYHPPVQTSVDPSSIFGVFRILNILDGGEMLASLTHDIQGRRTCSRLQVGELIPNEEECERATK